MDIIAQPDMYSPSIGDNGNYIDKIPTFNNIKHGLRCPCGSRKDKVYDTRSIFSSHIKSIAHQKWLQDLNLNKTNYFTENEELKQIVANQKLIISKQEKEIALNTMMIEVLKKHVIDSPLPLKDINLLEFD